MNSSPQQILEILKSVKSTPKWPSQVTVPGMNDFDATHQAQKMKLFEELATKGFLTRVPGKTGIRTGRGFILSEKGQAEMKLLSRTPGVAK